MDYKTLSFKDVKEIIAQQRFQRFPYLKNFSKNPYSYLKGRYYMYCSFFLVRLESVTQHVCCDTECCDQLSSRVSRPSS